MPAPAMTTVLFFFSGGAASSAATLVEEDEEDMVGNTIEDCRGIIIDFGTKSEVGGRANARRSSESFRRGRGRNFAEWCYARVRPLLGLPLPLDAAHGSKLSLSHTQGAISGDQRTDLPSCRRVGGSGASRGVSC
mmetsp:Transcript_25242/g.74220  ORF Transcript_25242/g.74220 Transcript_25242/m.74220 type:complete len:135 (-) Transcript_25242:91-495(-)